MSKAEKIKDPSQLPLEWSLDELYRDSKAALGAEEEEQCLALAFRGLNFSKAAHNCVWCAKFDELARVVKGVERPKPVRHYIEISLLLG